MVKSRHGKEWTKDEDRQLTDLFYSHHSFRQMGDKLGRTWFACKCRLARLQLIPPFKNSKEYWGLIGDMEQYRVPYPHSINDIFEGLENMCFGEDSVFTACGCCSGHIDSQEASTVNVFSDSELDVIKSWLKIRLSLIVCELADDTGCIIKQADLNQVKDVLETEIQLVNNMKKMTLEEREKVCKRLC